MSTAIVIPTMLVNKGISLDAPEEFLLDQLSPYSRNMEYLNELIQARTGLAKFSATALTGRVMLQFRFVKANLNAYNFFFTTKDIYTYDFTNTRFDIWTPVYTTGTIEVQAGTPTILRGTGTLWVANTKVGDYVKLGAGSIHTGSTWYQVTVVTSDTQLTVASAMPTTAAGSAYVIRKTYTGGNTDFWTCTKFTDSALGDIVVATNGVDTPLYLTGIAAAVALTGLVSTMKAKYVTAFFDRLVFAWTVEGGSNQPERYRWSAVANANGYTSADFEDLIDDGSGITGQIKHGAYLIITKEKVFYAVRPVSGTDIYDSERTSTPQGCKSNRSLVVDKQWLYYYSVDKKFHRWNLVTDQIISEGQFEDTKNFDPNLELYITGDNFYHKNQIRWFCPLNSATYQNVVFVFDYKNESMNIWTTGAEQALLSIGHYLLQDDIYFDDAIWGEYFFDERTEYFDDVNFLSNAPQFIYGGYDGYIRNCDTTAQDDGTAYTRTLRLKRLNFQLPQIKKRLWKQQYWLEQAASGTVSISIYVDDKIAANSVGTLSLVDATKDVVKLTQTVDLNGYVFQIEISATNFFALIGFLSYIFPKRRSF